MGILDLLFPEYCVSCKKLGSYICPNCFSTITFTTGEKCLVCNRPSIDGLTHPYCKTKYAIDGAFTGIEYKGIVKKLLYQFKYDPYISDLKNTLCELLYESLIQKEMFVNALSSSPPVVITPIPLHPSKLRKRGYNQAEILARELSRKLGFETMETLKRVKDTKSQFQLNRKERQKNIKGAFNLKKSKDSLPNKILLIDDVLTTGSTLSEAAQTLKHSGVKEVWGIALAQD